MSQHTRQEIAILDFGSQYTHLLARRIRTLGVFTHIYSPDISAKQLSHAKGIILSGGPGSVIREPTQYDPSVLSLPIPLLGVCYGHQLMAHALGGSVTAGTTREYGKATMRIIPQHPSELLKGIPSRGTIWMSHGDSVQRLPDGFTVSGRTATCPVAAMADDTHKRYGVQFHPEVTHTEYGEQILKNFIRRICGLTTSRWTMRHELPRIIQRIREHVRNRNVFLLVSGGVDSTVVYALLQRALGKRRVHALYVDTGFMREGESERITSQFQRAGMPLMVENAQATFLRALAGASDPETKRERIGKAFLHVQRRVQRRLGFSPRQWLLGQGTIYPDTIESGGSRHSARIKTHHNRIGVLQTMAERGHLVEPLAELYKDEVRAIGRLLNLPRRLINRHPFPGPGLAIRLLCSARGDRAPRRPGPIVRRLLRYRGKEQSGLVLPMKSVGVQGDSRTYAHPLAVFANAPWSWYDRIAPEIANATPMVNRVVRVLHGSPKAVSAARTRRALCTIDRLALLKKADQCVRAFTMNNKLDTTIWQFPVVLAPFGTAGESCILRPVISREAMTVHAFPMATQLLHRLVKQLKSIRGIDFIFYDVTNKPPATIEWE